ncbi:VTT domain-containing protein [Caballeronia sp. LjRoot34]|uniref:VTT domain-containing protein n=1 Tax=Caballeronia sp. LjRoot34 TaxID=3342325 RepID=UPI003ED17280
MIQIPPSAIENWGSAAVFVNVLVTRLGVPLPAIPVLVFAGSAIAGGSLVFSHVLCAAVVAALLGDGVWFFAGRIYGRRLTDFLGRMSLSLDASVRTTRALFERFGVAIVAVSKFVPGLALITPPLMGTTLIAPAVFVVWDALGTVAWASFWLLGGALFERQLGLLLSVLRPHGGSILDVLFTAAVLYLTYRYLLRWRFRKWLSRRIVSPERLNRMMHSSTPPLVLDARPVSVRRDESYRIPGALLLDVESLETMDANLSASNIVVYGMHPNDATARKVRKQLLGKNVVNVRVLYGGLDEWVRRGYAVEPLPPALNLFTASMARF